MKRKIVCTSVDSETTSQTTIWKRYLSSLENCNLLKWSINLASVTVRWSVGDMVSWSSSMRIMQWRQWQSWTLKSYLGESAVSRWVREIAQEKTRLDNIWVWSVVSRLGVDIVRRAAGREVAATADIEGDILLQDQDPILEVVIVEGGETAEIEIETEIVQGTDRGVVRQEGDDHISDDRHQVTGYKFSGSGHNGP